MSNAPTTQINTFTQPNDSQIKDPNFFKLRQRQASNHQQQRETEFGYVNDTDSEGLDDESEYTCSVQVEDDAPPKVKAPATQTKNLSTSRQTAKKPAVNIDIPKSKIVSPITKEANQFANIPEYGATPEKQFHVNLTQSESQQYVEARRDLQYMFANTKEVMTRELYTTYYLSYPVLAQVPYERFLQDCRQGRYFVAKQLATTGVAPVYMMKKRPQPIDSQEHERQLAEILATNWQWISKRAKYELESSEATLPISSADFFTQLFKLDASNKNVSERAKAFANSCCENLGDVFVKEFLDNDAIVPPQTTLAHLPNRYKISAFIKIGKVSVVYTRLLRNIGAMFSQMVSKTAINELKQIPVQPNASEFFNSILECCLTTDDLLMSNNLLLLLQSQQCLRTTLLPWQDLFVPSSMQAGIQLPKAINDLQQQLPQFIGTLCGQSQEVADFIIKSPGKLLWEGLLDLLRSVQHKVSLIKVVLLVQSGNVDPSTNMHDFASILEQRPILYAELLRNDAAKIMGYTGLRSFFDCTKSWSLAQVYTAIQQFGSIDKVAASSIAASQSRCVIIGDSSNDHEAKVKQLARQHHCETQFDMMLLLQKAWKAQLGQAYNVLAGQSFYAARAINASNRAIVVQLAQGNGKTFGNFQIAVYKSQNPDHQVFYVTIDRWLQQQVLQKIKMLGVERVKVILQSEILEHMTDTAIFIFDEYYHALVRTKLRYCQSKKLNPIFRLGKIGYAYLSSGHNSPQFQQFIQDHYGGEAAYQVNNSMKQMQGLEQHYHLTLKSAPNLEQAQALAILLLQKLAKLKPILCFGLKWDHSERFGLGPQYPVKQVAPQDNIDQVRQLVANCSRGIIGLPIEASIGLDLRFSEDAVVVIVSETPPNPEDTKQMVARGSRSFDSYEGYLFYVGEPDMEAIMEREQKTTGGYDFKDGARVIEVLERLPKELPAKTDLNAILKMFNNNWMITIEEMKRNQTEKVATIIDQLLDKIMMERAKTLVKARQQKPAGK